MVIELEVVFVLVVRGCFLVCYDWLVGVDKVVVDVVYQCEVVFEIEVVEIVEEQFVYVVWFVMVFDIEIVVVLVFEFFVEIVFERCVGVSGGLVLGYCVFFEVVEWGQVEIIVELLYWWFVFFFGDEEMYVGVVGGYVGVMWVNYQ